MVGSTPLRKESQVKDAWETGLGSVGGIPQMLYGGVSPSNDPVTVSKKNDIMKTSKEEHLDSMRRH